MRVMVASLAAAFLLSTASVRAETREIAVVCGPRDAVSAYLRDEAHASLVGFGTATDKQQLPGVWAAPEGKFTWMVAVYVTERSCILRSGIGWALSAAPAGAGSPS